MGESEVGVAEGGAGENVRDCGSGSDGTFEVNGVEEIQLLFEDLDGLGVVSEFESLLCRVRLEDEYPKGGLNLENLLDVGDG